MNGHLDSLAGGMLVSGWREYRWPRLGGTLMSHASTKTTPVLALPVSMVEPALD